MTEIAIDNYFNKISELDALCNNPLTTPEQLNTFVLELEDLRNIVDGELDTLPFPTSTLHLRKLIYFEIERNNNSFIQSNLLNLIKTKIAYADEYVNTAYPMPNETDINGEIIAPSWDATERFNYALNYHNSISIIKNIVNDVISSCNCMNNRRNIIENNNKLC